MSATARQGVATAPARIHLRIKHPDLEPTEITDTIGIKPEHTLEPGRSVSSASVERLHADCYWIAPLPFATFDEPWLMGGAETGASRDTALSQVSALSMMEHESVVAMALRQLQPHQSFFHRILEDGGTATLLITPDKPGSITIQPMLARKLAETGLALELDWSGGAE
jgi:hypothetical protein